MATTASTTTAAAGTTPSSSALGTPTPPVTPSSVFGYDVDYIQALAKFDQQDWQGAQMSFNKVPLFTEVSCVGFIFDVLLPPLLVFAE